jgi:outer membrane protein assembly factor BamB
MDQGRVVTFNANTGERGVSYQTFGWTWGAPVVTKDRVYFGSQDGHFYAFDKATGKRVWRYKTKGRADSGGAVDEESVYFGSSDGNLYCVAIADGKERWKKPSAPAEGRPKGVYSTPVLRKNVVYTASGEGVVYALAAHTGDELWHFRPADDSDVYHPLLFDGSHFVTVVRQTVVEKRSKGESAVVAVGVK